MDSLILENFRCFASRQEVPLRPLTLLVGENSTGKTSLLAGARLIENLHSQLVGAPNFNEEPFLLGAYEEITHIAGRRNGRTNSFALGSTFHRRLNGRDTEVRAVVEFANEKGRPIIRDCCICTERYEIRVDFSETKYCLTVRTPSKPKGVTGSMRIRPNSWHLRLKTLEALRTVLFDLCYGDQAIIELNTGELEDLTELLLTANLVTNAPPFAAAPIRAQPRRTYDPLSEAPRPEGDHIPEMLARIYGQNEWELIRQPMESFASAAGLFDKIIVKQLGKSESSPFQIHVKLPGVSTSRNLIDVGYGVSQVLPLLVEMLRDKHPRMYLIQQPEVHLHPRAQAELGTLLATIAKTHKKQLLIETHSDYIVDRVRMDVRSKALKADDVMILFFERERNNVTIHPIRVDDHGNLIDPPPSYGSFFFQEEARFLGLADVHNY